LDSSRVVLVGHSVGANAVREYQAQTQDPRVVGLVLASGDVRPDTRVPPPGWISKAKQFLVDGQPESTNIEKCSPKQQLETLKINVRRCAFLLAPMFSRQQGYQLPFIAKAC
jgi:pimeloyl-ACP methyl ester carboxylesterase